jgi:Zn-dependent protease
MGLAHADDLLQLKVRQHSSYPRNPWRGIIPNLSLRPGDEAAVVVRIGWYNPLVMLNFNPIDLATKALVLLVAFPIHEFAHAWTADNLGDDTPRLNGRLTLNPLAHLDVLGTLIFIFAWFGWAKPVPINPYALQRRTPAGVMLVAAAGPLSNLLLALLAAIPFRAGLISPYEFSNLLSVILTTFIFVNLLLLFFNLIPVFPLDGEKILMYLLPPNGQDFLMRIRPYGMYILMLGIVLGQTSGLDVFGVVIGGATSAVYNLLVP